MIPCETDAELRSRLRGDVEWFTSRGLSPAGLSFLDDSIEVMTGEALDRLAEMLGSHRFEAVPDLGIEATGPRADLTEIDIYAERLDGLDVCIGTTIRGDRPPYGVELDRDQVKQIVAVMTAWLARTEHV